MRCSRIFFVICISLTVFTVPASNVPDNDIIQEDNATETTEPQPDLTDVADNDLENEKSEDLNIKAELSDSEAQIVHLSHNTTISSNVTISNSTNVNNTAVQVICLRNKTDKGYAPVEIVNSTRLAGILQVDLNVTSRQVPGNCVVVLFYSPSCIFSCQVAPHFNALPRLFPDIKMVALDAMTHRIFNAQYGIFGIPTLIIFHNGRPAARLDEISDYSWEDLSKFIKNCTNLEPVRKLVVTSADFRGPLPFKPVKERDYYLLLSWIVIVLRILYSFYCSSWGRWLADATLSAWREAEAQHHHID